MKINKEEWNRSVYEYPFRKEFPPKTKPEPQDLKDQDVTKHIIGHIKRVKRQIMKELCGVRKDIKNIWRKCNEANLFLR